MGAREAGLLGKARGAGRGAITPDGRVRLTSWLGACSQRRMLPKNGPHRAARTAWRTLNSSGAADLLCSKTVFSRSWRTAHPPKLMDLCPISIVDRRMAATTGSIRTICGGGWS